VKPLLSDFSIECDRLKLEGKQEASVNSGIHASQPWQRHPAGIASSRSLCVPRLFPIENIKSIHNDRPAPSLSRREVPEAKISVPQPLGARV
jgi:hypothetical protein